MSLNVQVEKTELPKQWVNTSITKIYFDCLKEFKKQEVKRKTAHT